MSGTQMPCDPLAKELLLICAAKILNILPRLSYQTHDASARVHLRFPQQWGLLVLLATLLRPTVWPQPVKYSIVFYLIIKAGADGTCAPILINYSQSSIGGEFKGKITWTSSKFHNSTPQHWSLNPPLLLDQKLESPPLSFTTESIGRVGLY